VHPVLFEIGGLTVNTYGVMIALGFLAALALAVVEGRRVGIEAHSLVDLCFWVLISGLLGGHLLFAVVNIKTYLAEPLRFLQFWRGGVVWYGGLLGGIAGGAVFLRIKQLPFWKAADIGMPAITVGLLFGRFGCLSAGCCYGKPTDLPWAVIYPGSSQLAPPGVPLHPSPLYEALMLVGLFVLLTWLRQRKRYHGQIFVLQLFYYGIGRFLLEILRGDLERGHLAAIDLFESIPGWEILSTSQLISLLLMVVGVALHLLLARKVERREPGPIAGLRRFLVGGT